MSITQNKEKKNHCSTFSLLSFEFQFEAYASKYYRKIDKNRQLFPTKIPHFNIHPVLQNPPSIQNIDNRYNLQQTEPASAHLIISQTLKINPNKKTMMTN